MTFSSFSFDRCIVAGIKSCGYVTPTPIQNQAIPLVLQGHDVMGLAETGTGKTAAFALPILQRLLARKAAKGAPSVLILAPTRELALQIHENFISLGKQTGMRSAVVIGGVGMAPQIKAFSHSHIIVALKDKGNSLVLDRGGRYIPTRLDSGDNAPVKRKRGKSHINLGSKEMLATARDSGRFRHYRVYQGWLWYVE